MKRAHSIRPVAAALLASFAVAGAGAAEPPPARIFTCIDAHGKKHVSQVPIADCNDRDIVQRNSDGSVRAVIRRPPTEKEREAEEAKLREAETACRDRKIEERANRNLVKRFPDRARHDAARKEAIDDIAKASDLSTKRIKDLLVEKKKLDDEREFYLAPAKLPSVLKLQIDKNDSALEAQNKLVATQRDELQRINARFDEELILLQKLWRTPPGMLSC